jgi:hypothetical protein
VTLILVLAIIVHTATAAVYSFEVHFFSPFDWLLLSAADGILLVAALTNRHLFTTRNFRLPGVAIVSLFALILIPLPMVTNLYESLLPRTMLVSIAAGIVAMSLVFLVPNKATKERLWADREFVSERYFIILILVFALFVMVLWVRSMSSIPIVEVIKGSSDAEGITSSRQRALSDLDSVGIRTSVGILRNLYLIFTSAWLVSDYLATTHSTLKSRLANQTWVVSGLLVSLVFAVLTTEKAIIIEVSIACFVAASVSTDKRVSLRASFLMASSVVFPILVLTRGAKADVFDALNGLGRRIFFLPSDVMAKYFAAFPADHPFLLGASIPKSSFLTGGETFDLSRYIYIRFYQRDIGVIGNANGSFIGVGWANFGAIGVVLWCVFLAIALVLLDRIIDGLPFRSSAAMRGLAVISTILLTSADIFRTVIGFVPGVLDIVLFLLILVLVENRRLLNLRMKPKHLG